MDVENMFPKNTCSLDGAGAISWTWAEYFKKKKDLGDSAILVDMIGQPVPGSTPLSNALFEKEYPKDTYFVLYCHSGANSGALQKRISPKYPEYTFINLKGGIGAYPESV